MRTEKNITYRIVEILDFFNISQTDFVAKTGIARAYVNDLVKGRALNPTLEKLIKISDAFDIDINWLASGEGNMFRHRNNKVLTYADHIDKTENKESILNNTNENSEYNMMKQLNTFLLTNFENIIQKENDKLFYKIKELYNESH